ncbi:hypothetical protein L210DRAFT_3611694 [Boletus edulis BED1]|uniref:Lytic polysaccharide monooxygenase n=1 Tax=Boletus edulis BED1 TaxID=1328754 RepID=A0AAD4BWQ9_BOLED|nr:hypothetical protein L210DRAFT_3611694 [Boletus edulis BED1]
MSVLLLIALFSSLRLASAHIALWHPSTWGFNVTTHDFNYDNRPVVPLMHRTFNNWWFHGYLNYPPHPEDIFELPAGQTVTTQLACDKSATTYYGSSQSRGDIQDPKHPNNPCPGWPVTQFHTTGLSDVKGCALAIAYKDDVSQVKPEDFTVFSVNQVCVWNRYTDFAVPAKMPPCPNGKCVCAWFWIHAADSGSEQMYMIGFQCGVTGSTSNVGLATPKVARRCGADPENGKKDAVPGNCTYGAKQPLYWFQAEGNNMFEGTYAPPFYNDLYNFKEGAQNDIFQDSYASMPEPGPQQTALPVLANAQSTTQSTTKSTLECPGKRDTSAFSRRHASAERRTFTHKPLGMRRMLDLEERSDLQDTF